MKKLLAALIVVSVFGISSTAFADGVYRWVDEKGRTVYSDLPPPPDAKKVEQRLMRGSQVETDKQPYAVRKAAESFPVSLYTAPGEKCPGCPLAKQYLAKRGIPYTEVSVENSQLAVDALKVLGGQEVEVPSLVVGGRPYKGYSASEWDAALDSAGYPPVKR